MASVRRTMRRKNMLMDQQKLDVAKAALGASSETAAVDAALDLVVFRTELAAAGGPRDHRATASHRVIYTLHTNVLVDALRQPAELDRLKTFLSWALPSTVLSSIVAAEILVALVDDNRISRDEHARLLNAEPGVTVVSAEATLSATMLEEHQPDVVLVEAVATEVLLLRAAATTRRVLPEASVIITDLVPANEDIADFVKAGVAGFVLKEATRADLIDTVRTVTDGAHVLPDELTSPLFVQIAAEGVEFKDESGRTIRASVAVTLSLREQEVVALIGEGLANIDALEKSPRPEHRPDHARGRSACARVSPRRHGSLRRPRVPTETAQRRAREPRQRGGGHAATRSSVPFVGARAVGDRAVR